MSDSPLPLPKQIFPASWKDNTTEAMNVRRGVEYQKLEMSCQLMLNPVRNTSTSAFFPQPTLQERKPSLHRQVSEFTAYEGIEPRWHAKWSQPWKANSSSLIAVPWNWAIWGFLDRSTVQEWAFTNRELRSTKQWGCSKWPLRQMELGSLEWPVPNFSIRKRVEVVILL